MRGIGITLSRLAAAAALFAGVALAGVIADRKAHAQPASGAQDTAFAVPRLLPRGQSSGIALPQPLPPSEAARIRRILALQARGDIATALRESAGLDATDPVVEGVLGHLVADRLLGRHTRASVAELRDWLDRWAELPDATAIHALLTLRLPRGAAVPPAPGLAALSGPAEPIPVPEESEPAGHTLARLPAVDLPVREAARTGPYGAAARAILSSPGLPPGYAALLRGEVGQILFALNRDREAYEIAAIGAESCLRPRATPCVTVALAGYWAGLAAWRQDRIEPARQMFELAAQAEVATSAQRAGAAFWAARAHLRLREPAGYFHWLERAAAEPRTFYGLLARRALGMGIERDSVAQETLGEADIEAVAGHAAGLRAFALLQLGQRERAEAELRLLWPAAQEAPALGRAVMLIAERAALRNLAAQLADLVQTADGRPRERTRFAIPDLRPAGGFTVDPAMVYAIARTESRFDPSLVSRAGAAGLMQIMPATARFVSGEAGAGNQRLQLHDPAVNLDLGQRYLHFLAGYDAISADLIKLLASYNSGPTAFGRWSGAIRDTGDPLLFIEAIPIDETRAFVPRVLTYTWIYAARLGLPSPSLDDLAAGAWPRYTAGMPLAPGPVAQH